MSESPVSGCTKNSHSLHIFDLEPHLLERIVAFLEDDERHALQASNKKWYWHVHQCRAHRSTGDAVRFGLLKQKSPEPLKYFFDSERPLFILTRQEADEEGQIRPSFLTECYLLSILRSERAVRIAYDERQRTYLPTFVDLLVQLGCNRDQTTVISFVVQSLDLVDEIASFLTRAVSSRLSTSNVIFAVNGPEYWISHHASEEQAYQYLRIANCFCIDSLASLRAFVRILDAPSMNTSQSQ